MRKIFFLTEFILFLILGFIHFFHPWTILGTIPSFIIAYIGYKEFRKKNNTKSALSRAVIILIILWLAIFALPFEGFNDDIVNNTFLISPDFTETILLFTLPFFNRLAQWPLYIKLIYLFLLLMHLSMYVIYEFKKEIIKRIALIIMIAFSIIFIKLWMVDPVISVHQKESLANQLVSIQFEQNLYLKQNYTFRGSILAPYENEAKSSEGVLTGYVYDFSEKEQNMYPTVYITVFNNPENALLYYEKSIKERDNIQSKEAFENMENIDDGFLYQRDDNFTGLIFVKNNVYVEIFYHRPYNEVSQFFSSVNDSIIVRE